MTPGMFRALCNRRNIRLKHERFANAQTAAAVYNVGRTSAEMPMLTGFDFVRDEEASKKRSEVLAIKASIKQSVGRMPVDTPRAAFLTMRTRMIDFLTAQGRTDAKELWAECWPELVPTEGETACQ
jgi:hypothetical protein